jgi:hypothetical protein
MKNKRTEIKENNKRNNGKEREIEKLNNNKLKVL